MLWLLEPDLVELKRPGSDVGCFGDDASGAWVGPWLVELGQHER
jgi:hypothetical protein